MVTILIVEEHIFPGTAMPSPDWWRALWPNPDKVIEKLGIGQGMTVLDLGCGDGYFTAAIARRAGSGQVIGFDLDPVVLDQAKAACKGMQNCTWLLGDAMELSKLITIPIDYVLIANTFHGVPNKTDLACEIAKVLKPDGYLTIVNWHVFPREETRVLGQPRGPRTESRMSPELVSAKVIPAGFYRDRLVELPPFHYAAIFRKA